MRSSTKWSAVCFALVALVGGSVPALASGSGGGGSSSGGGAPGCASVVPDAPYYFGRGNLKFVFSGTVTNCGTAASTYTMRVTDVGVHADPLCSVGSTSYRLIPVAAGASQWWWQATGSGVCLNDYYTLQVDVLENNTVLTSAVAHWGTPPAP